MEIAAVHAIVTGASSGLGRHFVNRLLAAGAAVMAGDADAAGLRSLRRETASLPGRLEIELLDVTDEAGVVGFVEQAPRRLGEVNGLINCAGILRDALLIERGDDGSMKKLPASLWRQVLEVNLTGSFLMAREFAAQRISGGQRDDAFVVNLSSIARAGNPGQSSYAASKAGVDAATRTWALELAPHGIRVGAIAPGVTETPFLRGISEAALEDLRRSIPLGRLGTPEDLWRAAEFIIECEFFTGRVLEVDGGASMGH